MPTFLPRFHPLPSPESWREGSDRLSPTACLPRTRGARSPSLAGATPSNCVELGGETLGGHEVSHLGRQPKNCFAQLFDPFTLDHVVSWERIPEPGSGGFERIQTKPDSDTSR